MTNVYGERKHVLGEENKGLPVAEKSVFKQHPRNKRVL